MSGPALIPAERMASLLRMPPGNALQPVQRACYETLSLALREGQVFAALTGPEGCGKTTVLEAVLAHLREQSLRCIRVSDPDKVPAKLAMQIEQTAYAEVRKPDNLGRHVLLVVDDAHAGSEELLGCLSRLAAMRDSGCRVPQVLLVGRPELWDRLAASEFEPLARRLAIRAELPAVETDDDLWASLEQELTQTRILRSKPKHPSSASGPEFEPLPASSVMSYAARRPRWRSKESEVPSPSFYPTRPDSGSPQARQAHRRKRRSRLLALLFSSAVAIAFVSSVRWPPHITSGLPWTRNESAATVQVPRPKEAGAPASLPIKPGPAAPAQASAPASQPPITPGAAVPARASAPALPPPVAPAAVPAEANAPASWPPITPAAAVPAETNASASRPPITPASAVPARASPPASPPPITPASAVPAEASAPAAPPVTPALTDHAQASAPLSALASVAQPSPVAFAATQPATACYMRPAELPLPPEFIALLLRRGNDQAAIGDLSAARLLYQRAGELGSAQGARLAAQTYDDGFLPPVDAAVLANRDAARHWYTCAAGLGDAEAASRLHALERGR